MGRLAAEKRLDIDTDELEEKHRELKTWAAVAKYYGISEKTIQRRIKENGQNGQNGQNVSGQNGQNGQNYFVL